MTPHYLEPNSLDWWEDYFEHKWEANSGREQTRGFMQALINALPDFVVRELRRPGATLLDWGCALGDGVDVLVQTFPQARVQGYEVSSRAISKARAAYPDYDFRLRSSDKLDDNYNAIFCSNVLEHFSEPLAELSAQLRFAGSYHISLVPYDERDLEEFHCVTLTEDSFPCRLEVFRKITERRIQTDPSLWPGEQLLVIYAAPTLFLCS